jgi:hypothetical protein
MKIIDVTFRNKTYTFRTNNDGTNLFVGVSSNTQISCESGFHSLRRIKRRIREWLIRDDFGQKTFDRVKYTLRPFDTWGK